MKKAAISIMASTGIILLVLSAVAAMYGGKAICINTIFEIAMLSILIHCGFIVTHRLDFRYPILEIMADIGYTLAITLILGAVLNWYRSTPVWVLAIMVFVIYMAGCLIDLYRTKEEVKVINELLENRRKNITNR